MKACDVMPLAAQLAGDIDQRAQLALLDCAQHLAATRDMLWSDRKVSAAQLAGAGARVLLALALPEVRTLDVAIRRVRRRRRKKPKRVRGVRTKCSPRARSA